MLASTFLDKTWSMFTDNIDIWLSGIRNTILLSIIGTIIGLTIAFPLVVLKVQTIKKQTPWPYRILRRVGKRFSHIYVGFFRGTPMMVQAMLLYFGLLTLGFRIPVLIAGLIVISLNTAAYLTEVLRSGLLGLDKGQTEAALSLGLTVNQTYRRILFPQALRNMLPAIGNELVVNIKDSSVLSVIGVTEIFYFGRRIGGASYSYAEAFIIVSLIYLIIVHLAVYLLERLTKIKPNLGSESGARI